ncbi:DNA starvation/stationary phase protection protein [Erysipelothrix sp. HDW6C]|uniref:Dps family protein n=1 Tax=Erysipelothrix sp. HDW6C TaxID=2714930 RepID=UPI00140CF31D|nr:DNA starvation/stationary phase protection protein [Erysipelothrix sp. HDW6C]QIK69660.1 DNA starvation/stationary phase protection protein [Erysipelothrix sp. HDW6C]
MNNLYEALNTFLADQVVVGMKIHNIHWFMKGQGFFPMHKQMDEFYEEAEERIDTVAERLLVIGDKPLGSLKAILDRTTIEELGEHEITAFDGVSKLIVDFESLNNLALHIIKLAEEDNDPGTADHFTSISQDLGKSLWMMKSYIK